MKREYIMEKEELEVMKYIFEKLIEIRQSLTGKEEADNFNSDEEDEDYEDYALIKSLQKDYEAFFKWAFNIDNPDEKTFDKEKACQIWEEIHPNFPIPRILKSKRSLPTDISTVCLFMDGYPAYLSTKKKCCG
jgi:hypothetical protein